MQIFVLVLAFMTFGNVFAFDCTAKKIYNSSVLDESFTVEEYPQVHVYQEKVTIGANEFSKAWGDNILIMHTNGFKKTASVTTSAGEQFLITFENRTGLREKGEVLYRANASEEFIKLARVSCIP